MKKVFLLILFIIPFVASAAPSVRVLGNKNIGGTQIIPAKTDNAKLDVKARSGTTLKTKTSGPTGVLTSNGSRFPVIAPVKPYNIVTQPSSSDKSSGGTGTTPGTSGTGSNTGSNTGSCNMCTDTINEIVSTVESRVEGNILQNYYDKTEVYNSNNFVEAVKDTVEDIDDPRIDAIRTRNPSNLHPGAQLPSDYIYMWIEQ